MTRRRKILVLLLLLVVGLPLALLVAALALGVPEMGSAHAAKVFGSAVFVGERSIDSIRANEFAQETIIDRVVSPFIDVSVDRENRTLTASLLGTEATGLFRPEIGFVLAPDGEVDALKRQAATGPPPLDPSRRDRPWPLGDRDALRPLADSARRESVKRVMDVAFAENADGPRLRTRALLVVHRGVLVGERYAEGFGPDQRLHGWSMTKSVVSALAGIAVRDGLLTLDEAPVLSSWPDSGDARSRISLRHLLGGTPGLEWEESYAGVNGDPAVMLFRRPGAGSFAAQRPSIAEPGTQGRYSSGTTNILCLALRERFDDLESFLAWPREALFEPVGLDSMLIEPDPDGVMVGSSFAWATARDWARFGLLYLNDGMVGDRRILPEGWVAASVTPAEGWSAPRYGWQWWLNRADPGDDGARAHEGVPEDAFEASGFQGQKLAIIPSRQTVIVRLGCTKVRSRFDAAALYRDILEALPE